MLQVTFVRSSRVKYKESRRLPCSLELAKSLMYMASRPSNMSDLTSKGSSELHSIGVSLSSEGPASTRSRVCVDMGQDGYSIRTFCDGGWVELEVTRTSDSV